MQTEIESARDALEKCYEIALQWEADELAGVAGTTDKPEALSASEALLEVERLCKSALALPRLNCEVGTAEEQAVRFGKLCDKYYNEEESCNKECPLASLSMIPGFPRCHAYWAQMPYEEKEGGEE